MGGEWRELGWGEDVGEGRGEIREWRDEVLGTKSRVNQIKSTMEKKITNRPHRMRHSNTSENRNEHGQDFQELQDIFKRANLSTSPGIKS